VFIALLFSNAMNTSVCPSHGWINQERLKLDQAIFTHPSGFCGVSLSRNSNGSTVPLSGGVKQGRGGETSYFYSMRQYLENGRRYVQIYY